MAEKISGVYKITNTVTGDFYIGSSKNVKRRWESHKWPSRWKRYKNNPMYQDFQKYGLENFVFEILEVVEPDSLKETEQQFIETLKPTYNNYRAKGWDIERLKESCRKSSRKYEKTEKRKKYKKEYNNQLCLYNGETLTLAALRMRFRKKGIPHPQIEAKKYLLQ